MADEKPTPSVATGRALYLARLGKREPTEPPARHRGGLTRLERGAARYRATGADRAALRAKAEADTAARSDPFTGGDAA